MRSLAIRASSLPELFDCMARWEAKHVLNMRLPVSGAIRLGTAVHAGTALFDQSRLNSSPLSADEAVGMVADTIYSPDVEVDWSDTIQREVEKIAIPLHSLYCEKIAPRKEYMAVESLCENLEFTDIGLTLTGTVDRVRKTAGGPGIADIKTGQTAVVADGAVKTAGHATQAFLDGKASAKKLAEIFGYRPGAIGNWVRACRKCNQLPPKPNGHRKKCFSDEELEELKQLLDKNADMTLEEIKTHFNKSCCLSAIHRMLIKLGYRNKTLCLT